MKMKRIENSTNGQARFQFPAKLIAPLSETTLTNSNGKNYKLCTVEYVAVSGEIKQATAAIYEGNYSKGELNQGTEYLCTATIAEDKEGKKVAYLQMSHLVAGAGFADIDDFGEIEEVSVEETTAKRVSALS